MTLLSFEKEKPERERVSHKIPGELRDKILELNEKHVPQTKKNVFFEYLMRYGIETYSSGLMAENIPFPSGALVQLNHMVDKDLMIEFKMHHIQHEPSVSRRIFLSYILALGIVRYEEEYTIYGFKKPD